MASIKEILVPHTLEQLVVITGREMDAAANVQEATKAICKLAVGVAVSEIALDFIPGHMREQAAKTHNNARDAFRAMFDKLMAEQCAMLVAGGIDPDSEVTPASLSEMSHKLAELKKSVEQGKV